LCRGILATAVRPGGLPGLRWLGVGGRARGRLGWTGGRLIARAWLPPRGLAALSLPLRGLTALRSFPPRTRPIARRPAALRPWLTTFLPTCLFASLATSLFASLLAAWVVALLRSLLAAPLGVGLFATRCGSGARRLTPGPRPAPLPATVAGGAAFLRARLALGRIALRRVLFFAGAGLALASRRRLPIPSPLLEDALDRLAVVRPIGRHGLTPRAGLACPLLSVARLLVASLPIAGLSLATLPRLLGLVATTPLLLAIRWLPRAIALLSLRLTLAAPLITLLMIALLPRTLLRPTLLFAGFLSRAVLLRPPWLITRSLPAAVRCAALLVARLLLAPVPLTSLLITSLLITSLLITSLLITSLLITSLLRSTLLLAAGLRRTRLLTAAFSFPSTLPA
jgi:hypothetical protein